MEIVVVGGGKLGEELCRDLNAEGHDLTLIDKNRDVLNRLVEDIDIQGVYGSGNDVEVQREAGVATCKLFIAVTVSDDINMIAAVLADKLGAQYAIARVRNNEYTNNEGFIRQQLGLDFMINQDKEASQDIVRVIDYPSSNFVEPFNHGKVNLVKIRVKPKSTMIGLTVSDIRDRIEDVVICIIERDYETLIPRGDTVIEADDEIDIISSKKSYNDFCVLAGFKRRERLKSAFIVGGSRINKYLLPALHTRGVHSKVIEINYERAQELATLFPNFEIIVGDGTDQDFLLEQRLHNYDISIGLTDSDEENLMIALFSKKIGVKKNITKVNRPNLTRLLSADQLDVLISPRKSVSDAIIRRVRSIQQNFDNHLMAYSRLATENTEAMEFSIASQDKVATYDIQDLPLKEGIIIGLIIRDDKRLIPSGSSRIQEGDHVIIINVGEKINKIDDILRKRGLRR